MKQSKRKRVYDKTSGICHLCFLIIPTLAEMTIDHFIPKSKGGSRAFSNLFPAHGICNRERGTLPVEEYGKFGKQVHLTPKCQCREGKQSKKTRAITTIHFKKTHKTRKGKVVPSFFAYQKDGVEKALLYLQHEREGE